MLRAGGLFLVILSLGTTTVLAGSLDFYRSGDVAVGLFNNLTGDTVDELVLRFSEPVEPIRALGVGADMQLRANTGGELRYGGVVVPDGTWEVDWLWTGPRLEYAAWLKGGEVVAEISVHAPTAAFGMMGSYVGQVITFFAPASSDPDGHPLVRYLWQWSDGVVAEGVTVERTFAAGSYEVILTVWDVDGEQASRLGRFEIEGCRLTVNVIGSGAVTQIPYQATYEYGTAVMLIATAAAHWDFVGWTGHLAGTDNPGVVEMLGDTTVTAVFSQHPYTLSIEIIGSGTVARDPDKVTYFYGEAVTLEAIPGEYWDFAGWSGDLSGTTNSETIMVLGDMCIAVEFVPLRLAFEAYGTGGGREIFVANVDGTEVTRLTANTSDDYWPEWSSDGNQVFFFTNRRGRIELFVMNADGSEQRPVATNGEYAVREYGCSTTDRIAVASSGADTLYSVDLDDGVVEILDNSHMWDGIEISPDGELIVANGYAIGSDGSGLIDIGSDVKGPDIHPDKLHIVYKVGANGRTLRVKQISTGDTWDVATYATEPLAPHWSPDGSFFYTAEYPYSASSTTYIYRFDRTLAHTLVAPVVRAWDMTVDNRLVAVMVRQDGIYSVGYVDLASGRLAVLYSDIGSLGISGGQARFSPPRVR